MPAELPDAYRAEPGDVLAGPKPQLGVAYTEIPDYGHLDTSRPRRSLDAFGSSASGGFDVRAAGGSNRPYPNRTPGGDDPCRSSLSTAQH
ncbi:hypothetical protein [Streptomyces sp.]|uniref:hypothetical protein n=1 Tax=Streptomyces sp. TaxID=1931 RepID=UPI002D79E1EA|nr:hypothetical protein [Streptomyces sp.]HET6357348.1 hypothetical protein [Streptomyces sp.]